MSYPSGSSSTKYREGKKGRCPGPRAASHRATSCHVMCVVGKGWSAARPSRHAGPDHRGWPCSTQPACLPGPVRPCARSEHKHVGPRCPIIGAHSRRGRETARGGPRRNGIAREQKTKDEIHRKARNVDAAQCDCGTSPTKKRRGQQANGLGS